MTVTKCNKVTNTGQEKWVDETNGITERRRQAIHCHGTEEGHIHSKVRFFIFAASFIVVSSHFLKIKI